MAHDDFFNLNEMIEMKKAFFLLLLFLSANAIITNASAMPMPIDNGDPVKSTDIAPFNSLVKVEYTGYICTGEFISPADSTKTDSNVVLTAGHCAIDFDSGATLDPDVYTIISADGKKKYTVSKVITHYDGKDNDYSLLVTNASSSNFIKLAPINITRNFLIDSSTPHKLLIAGYGINLKTNTDTNSNLTYSLLKGYVIPTTDKYAKNTIDNGSEWIKLKTGIDLGNSNSLYDKNYMLATCPYPSKNQSTDHGDSGGPAIYRDPETSSYYLVGDTSWGLTISSMNRYYSYSNCINYQGMELTDSRISVFTDLTYGSKSYQLLVDDLRSI